MTWVTTIWAAVARPPGRRPLSVPVPVPVEHRDRAAPALITENCSWVSLAGNPIPSRENCYQAPLYESGFVEPVRIGRWDARPVMH
ncbi:hypothetical protein Pen02_29430 [Plantactinospora endophytica]|uniref:Uncharacterized protein n=1 Tax=Plantactinospora endophytica TaxID=673535 RepID=A0ABQ4E0Y6_9ACTN|nr:hypothetical protein Pen02_29430 [Plantactinospora endophytica]